MAVYIPPSIRTVREDIQASVSITGGEVVPALIGTSLGKNAIIPAYQASLHTTPVFTFPALGLQGPVNNLIEVRSKSSGGITYKSGFDYVFNQINQTIDFSAATPLDAPYIFEEVEVDGASTLSSGTTYYWVITARKPTDINGPVMGETVASNQVSQQMTAANKQVRLSWLAVTGATEYRVYRTTVPGDYTGTKLIATVSGTFNTVFLDTGVSPISGSPPGLPTNGISVAANTAPYTLAPSQTLTVSVNGGGAQTVTFSATAAARTGVAGTYPTLFVGGETLSLKIDGGVTQLVTFTSGDQALLDVINRINSTIVGGAADNNSGQLRIKSDRLGTGSSVQIVGGTSLTKLGHTAGTTTGTGNVFDINSVTANEVSVAATAQLTGAIGGISGNGNPFVQTSTSGSSGSIQVSGGTAAAAIGFDNTIHTGSNSSAATALRRPALNSGSGTDEPFFLDYSYKAFFHFQVQRYTNLGNLISDYGLGSDLATGATLAMAGSGRGNNASIVLACSVPNDDLISHQTALQFLAKRKDVTLVVPLTVVSGIQTSVRDHVDTMSRVDFKRERLGIVGLPIGTQVGDEDTSGTAIFTARQLNDRRMILTYPWAFANVQGADGTVVETELDGWAVSAALAGLIASLPDRATSPTAQVLAGFTRLGVTLDEPEENLCGGSGVCVVTLEDGNVTVRDGITTTLDNEADAEISINLTDDLLRTTLRSQFKQFRGRKLLPNLLDQIQKRTIKILQQFVKFTLIAGFDPESVSATQDPDRLTFVIVRFSYQPIFPVRVIEFRYSFDLRTASLAA